MNISKRKILSYILILASIFLFGTTISYIVEGYYDWHGFFFSGMATLILSSLVYGRDSYLVLVFRMTAKRIELHKEKMKKELKNE